MKKISILLSILFVFSTLSFANELLKSPELYNAYFDSATGHKYVKVDPSRYAQFARNGKFVKNVSHKFSRLNITTKVYPISDNSYILYEKYSQGQFNQKLLPGFSAHPVGWKAKKILFSQKQ